MSNIDPTTPPMADSQLAELENMRVPLEEAKLELVLVEVEHQIEELRADRS